MNYLLYGNIKKLIKYIDTYITKNINNEYSNNIIVFIYKALESSIKINFSKEPQEYLDDIKVNLNIVFENVIVLRDLKYIKNKRYYSFLNLYKQLWKVLHEN